MKQKSSCARNPGKSVWQRGVTPGASRWGVPGGSLLLTGRPEIVTRPYQVTLLGSADEAPTVRHAAAEEDPRLARMRVEAVLLLAKTPLNPRKLAQLAHLADATEARTLVRQLNQVYDTLGRELRVEHVAGGFRLLTRPELAPWLARLGHVPAPRRLSTPMMETLAVIAYRQPVSRASAEAVRGVACGELLRQLMERELIRIVGRGEELGRPYLYGTTKRFLQLFGLPNVDALPPIQWETLQEDPIAEDSPHDDLSTSTKEPVVSMTVAPVLTEIDLEAQGSTTCLAPPSGTSADPAQPVAIDDDDDFFEDDEEDDDDWDDDDWDDEDDDLDEDEDDDDELDDDVDDDDKEKLDEDEDEDDDDDKEKLDEDDDDLADEKWEEVDDKDDDEDWDEDDDDDWDDDDDLDEDDDEEWA